MRKECEELSRTVEDSFPLKGGEEYLRGKETIRMF
jgi:hypothetical protein